MTLVVPIVVTAFLIGMFAKKMTPGLWSLMALIILGTIVYFYAKH